QPLQPARSIPRAGVRVPPPGPVVQTLRRTVDVRGQPPPTCRPNRAARSRSPGRTDRGPAMQLSDATPATIRTARVAAFGLGLGLVFVLGSARGWGQQSAPTVPTIPVPVPVVRTHPAHALSPDLPIRKEQAMRGITASAADLQKVHNEVVQDVTRLYYTVVYARQQELLAAEVAGRLDVFADVAKSVLESKKPGTMTPAKLDAMKIGLAEARTVRAQTQYGQKQAMAALRE